MEPLLEELDTYNDAAEKTIDLGNNIAKKDEEADVWDIADGLLAGAIQYWLYARVPCGDPTCEDCEPVDTAEKRLKELMDLTREIAVSSEYYHSPMDANAGNA
ncbi:MAG: hypothetical protein ACNYPI_01865 [Arenicellales bacterium WSBS_2016_MAG_OTU3]